MNCLHTEGPRHDCRYVDARNDLIWHAQQIANMESPPREDGSWRIGDWNSAYMAAMTRLWLNGDADELTSSAVLPPIPALTAELSSRSEANVSELGYSPAPLPHNAVEEEWS